MMRSDEPLDPRERRRLDEFLARHRDAGGMDPSALDGLLCAVAIGPAPMMPTAWLPYVWGEGPPQFESTEHAQQIVALLLRRYHDVLSAAQAGRYVPELPAEVPQGASSRAQSWCAGFVCGISLDPAWEKLLGDREMQMSVLPILALADPSAMFEDASGDPEASEPIISQLPQLVAIIARYWLERSQSRRSRKGAAQTPAKPKAVRAGASKPGPARTTAQPDGQLQTVHRLRIALRGVRPPVWRRLEVPSDTKLPALNQILQAAMGWTDTHLHAFRVRDIAYGAPDPNFPSGMRDERRVTLGEIAPQPKSRFVFEYDFGDGWEHDVTVVAIEEAKPGQRYPRCLAGKRACPPEDCGGPWGYEELLEALGDPTHEEHVSLTGWAGEFDPEEFDLEDVDAELATFAPSTRTRKPRRKRA